MPSQAWNVTLNGKSIDIVHFDTNCDADYVKRSLIDHDGYDSGINVRRYNGPRKKTEPKPDPVTVKYGSMTATIKPGSSENVYIDLGGFVHGKPGGDVRKIARDKRFAKGVEEITRRFAAELSDYIDTFLLVTK